MSKPIVNILWLPGKNCHNETARLFKKAGAIVNFILLERLLKGMDRDLHLCDILCNCGGFGNGDHIRSGQIAAHDLSNLFLSSLRILFENETPILGVCNGFQDQAAAGLFNGEIGNPTLLMDHNRTVRFEHWSNTKVVIHDNGDCVWTKGLDGMIFNFPAAHGEGVPVNLDSDGPKWKIAATYGSYEGIEEYPISPNGSRIAGINYKNILGIMPHPERNPEEGIILAENAVNAVRG